MEEKVSLSRLIVGTKVELSREDEPKLYSATLQEINDYNLLTTPPLRNGTYLTFKKGDKINCKYTDKDGTYKFETTFLLIKKDLYVFQKPESMLRVQMREYVRFHLSLPVIFNDGDRGTIANLSSGGMLLISNTPLKPGDEILLNLEFTGIKKPVSGQVIRKINKDRFGIEFLDISSFDRDLIMGYIFRKMVQRRKTTGSG